VAASAAAAFGGQGSRGNGAAMRVVPLGAYRPDRPRLAAQEAIRSTEVTHAHPEGVAGAVLVAVAAAHAAAARLNGTRPPAAAPLDRLRPYLIDGPVQRGVARAKRLIGRSVDEAACEPGNGSRVTAQDLAGSPLKTPCRSRCGPPRPYLADYPAAVTACVQAGGDVDTTAAIVGGIVAAYTGIGDRPDTAGVPPAWIQGREPLPGWATRGDGDGAGPDPRFQSGARGATRTAQQHRIASPAEAVRPEPPAAPAVPSWFVGYAAAP
jgi:ADP-ribosylglycohydrolase